MDDENIVETEVHETEIKEEKKEKKNKSKVIWIFICALVGFVSGIGGTFLTLQLSGGISSNTDVIYQSVVQTNEDGEAVDALRKEVAKMVNGKQVFINIVEIKNPDVVAQLVANKIAEQLENRASFRTVQKRAVQAAMRAGAKGIKTAVSGRLGGADMARTEGYSEGVVPLHTLRADIDYATAEADTTYGKLGVKVWICKGEILPEKKKGDK